jgi:predicted ATPase
MGRREGVAAQQRAEAVLGLSTKQGFGLNLGYAMFVRGWALAAQGQREEGITQMQQGLATTRAMGTILGETWSLVPLAEPYGVGGQTAEGLRLVAEALAHVDRTGERFYEAEVYRLKGDLVLRQAVPDAPQADACFQQALDVARLQEAKSLELRAAMSLGRLWQQQGKRTETYELLAPVYDWCTEGFDPADLQEAKTLLEELGR